MLIDIHPVTPQERKIKEVVGILKGGGIIVCPTDSHYALCCAIDSKSGADRIIQIRQIDGKTHFFSLICKDLSDLSKYARVNNSQYRLLKAILPGAYTLILQGSREVPKRLLMQKRDTVGLRVPNNSIIQSIVAELDQPLLSMTLKVEGLDPHELNTPSIVYEHMKRRVDAVIDGGSCIMKPTSVIDLSKESPEVLREGEGSIDLFN